MTNDVAFVHRYWNHFWQGPFEYAAFFFPDVDEGWFSEHGIAARTRYKGAQADVAKQEHLQRKTDEWVLYSRSHVPEAAELAMCVSLEVEDVWKVCIGESIRHGGTTYQFQLDGSYVSEAPMGTCEATAVSIRGVCGESLSIRGVSRTDPCRHEITLQRPSACVALPTD